MATTAILAEFLATQRLGILSTVNAEGLPESAAMGIAVTPDLEIIFDTVTSTRKYGNLLAQPRCAWVIGWGSVTVQYEGEARLLGGAEDDHLREAYFAAYPDGRDRLRDWEGVVHFVVRPRWVRYTAYAPEHVIEEWRF